MTVIHAHEMQPASRGIISSFIANSLGAISAWNDARATRNALNRLSDRDLNDIGLSRSDIDVVARQITH